MAQYEIRRDGVTVASSSIAGLGYPPEILRDMEQHGYVIYVDGKPRRKRDRGSSENP